MQLVSGSARPEDDVKAGATKFDGGKLPVFQGFLKYFARAIKGVTAISDYGYKKYGTWGGWRDVPDGENRYADAKARHLIEPSASDDIYDAESGFLHAAHEAWNAMAVLEKLLENGTPLRKD